MILSAIWSVLALVVTAGWAPCRAFCGKAIAFLVVGKAILGAELAVALEWAAFGFREAAAVPAFVFGAEVQAGESAQNVTTGT